MSPKYLAELVSDNTTDCGSLEGPPLIKGMERIEYNTESENKILSSMNRFSPARTVVERDLDKVFALISGNMDFRLSPSGPKEFGSQSSSPKSPCR
jgi:hypothetical protein